jgi:hypothetical protein
MHLCAKTFKPEHECGNQYKNSRVDAEYLSVKYMPSFKDEPTWTPYALRQMVKRDHNIYVPLGQCWRATMLALRAIFGSHLDQYRHARRNGGALMKWNPRSSAFVQREGTCF